MIRIIMIRIRMIKIKRIRIRRIKIRNIRISIRIRIRIWWCSSLFILVSTFYKGCQGCYC